MRKRNNGKTDVALIGRERPGDENLALRYLAGALAKAGHRPHIVPLCGPHHFESAASAVTGLSPLLSGISIPDGDMAVDALTFARYLRRRGFNGHLTCGGAFATLTRHDILSRHRDFNSVIRQAGEVPIVELASRLARGAALNGIPGMTTAAGDGAPAAVADTTPMRTRPLRGRKLPTLMGVPVARLLASRGCPGRCPYCGPAALQCEAVEEGLRAGLKRADLSRLGVGGTWRREPSDVADEAAELYKRKGARFFVLLDENLLSGESGSALAWIRTLARELDRRRIGKTAWSLQIEAAAVSDEMTEALVALGVIRVLLGVEALTAKGLRSLGRRSSAQQNLCAIERMRHRGIVTAFNTLIVHPGATKDSISAELDALAGVKDHYFDVLAVSVIHGTEMWRRLWHAHELSGGMISWNYPCRDPVAARFRAALVRFRLMGMGRCGAGVLAHDIALNSALAGRLWNRSHARHVENELLHVLNEVNARRLDVLRAALDLASTPLPEADRVAETDRLTCRLTKDMNGAIDRLLDLQSKLEKRYCVPDGPSRLFFGSAVASTFFLCGTLALGCYSSTSGSHQEDASDVVETTTEDMGTDAQLDHDAWDVVGDEAGDTGDDEACTYESDVRRLRDALSSARCPCEEDDPATTYGLVIDEMGRVVDVRRLDGGVVPEDIRACYMDALSGETFPCIGATDFWQLCHICIL